MINKIKHSLEVILLLSGLIGFGMSSCGKYPNFDKKYTCHIECRSGWAGSNHYQDQSNIYKDDSRCRDYCEEWCGDVEDCLGYYVEVSEEAD